MFGYIIFLYFIIQKFFTGTGGSSGTAARNLSRTLQASFEPAYRTVSNSPQLIFHRSWFSPPLGMHEHFFWPFMC